MSICPRWSSCPGLQHHRLVMYLAGLKTVNCLQFLSYFVGTNVDISSVLTCLCFYLYIYIHIHIHIHSTHTPLQASFNSGGGGTNHLLFLWLKGVSNWRTSRVVKKKKKKQLSSRLVAPQTLPPFVPHCRQHVVFADNMYRYLFATKEHRTDFKNLFTSQFNP